MSDYQWTDEIWRAFCNLDTSVLAPKPTWRSTIGGLLDLFACVWLTALLTVLCASPLFILLGLMLYLLH